MTASKTLNPDFGVPKKKPYVPPAKGSLRSWLWVEFLKDNNWYNIEAAIIKAHREDYLKKCSAWYVYWLEKYQESEVAGCRAYTSHGWGTRRLRSPRPDKDSSGAYTDNNRYRTT